MPTVDGTLIDTDFHGWAFRKREDETPQPLFPPLDWQHARCLTSTCCACTNLLFNNSLHFQSFTPVPISLNSGSRTLHSGLRTLYSGLSLCTLHSVLWTLDSADSPIRIIMRFRPRVFKAKNHTTRMASILQSFRAARVEFRESRGLCRLRARSAFGPCPVRGNLRSHGCRRDGQKAAGPDRADSPGSALVQPTRMVNGWVPE